MRKHISLVSLLSLLISASVFANYSSMPQVTPKHAKIFGVDFPVAANLSGGDWYGYKGKLCNDNPKLCNYDFPTIV